MNEKIRATRDESGKLHAFTWDGNGQRIEFPLDDQDKISLNALLDKAKSLRPKYELDIEQADMAAKKARDIASQALIDKTEADKSRAQAETDRDVAVTEKIQAVTARAQAIKDKVQAEAERDQAKAREKEWQDKLAQYLTGGLVDNIDDETIRMYVELTKDKSYGIVIDEGEWYRIGLHLIRAKDNFVLDEEHWPLGDHGTDYWEGVPFDDAPATVKYPAGTVIEWSGVKYKSKVDTDMDPGQAPGDWDLAPKS